MIRRSLAFILVGFVIVVGAEAQTPAPQPKAETHTFSMFFDGDGGYLGVQTAEITKDNFAKYGLRDVRGVAIEKVIEGSPAEKAGLQVGDVIVRFGSEDVTSIRKLTRLLGEVSPDHQVSLTIIRSGGEREIVATVGKRPMPRFDEGAFANIPRPPFPASPDFPPMPKVEALPRIEAIPGTPAPPFAWRTGPSRRIGVAVNTLTKQLGDHFGVAAGVMIAEVRPDSPAAKAGLKAGDIVVEADGKEVKGEADLVRAIHESKGADVALTIVRDRNRQTIRVTPEEVKNGFRSFEFSPDGNQFKLAVPDGNNFRFAVPMTPAPMTEFRFHNRIL